MQRLDSHLPDRIRLSVEDIYTTLVKDKNMNNQKIKNLDVETVEGFGDEWTRFDQSNLSVADQT